MQGCRGKALRCLCVHRAFIVRSSYAFDPRGGYKYKDRGKHQAYIHHISTEAYLFVMAIIPQRVAILRRMLRDEEERHDFSYVSISAKEDSRGDGGSSPGSSDVDCLDSIIPSSRN